jgi:hypothetical protein
VTRISDSGLQLNLIEGVAAWTDYGACVFNYHGARQNDCSDNMTQSACYQMERDMHGVTVTWYRDKKCSDLRR